MVIVEDLFLSTRAGDPPSMPCPCIIPCGSAMAAAPVDGDLFQPEVTPWCPQDPSSSPKHSSYQAQDMLEAAKSYACHPPLLSPALSPHQGMHSAIPPHQLRMSPLTSLFCPQDKATLSVQGLG